MVSSGWLLPASVNDCCIENSGMAMISRMTSAVPPAIQGWCCTTRLQRYEKVCSLSTSPRCMKRWMPNLSMFCPEKPSMAGSSVTAAAMTSSTAAMHPMARP